MLIQADDGWWVARNEATGAASQGKSRQDALEKLDEAVRPHRGESGVPIETWAQEREVLKNLDIDPDEVKQARDEHDGRPDSV